MEPWSGVHVIRAYTKAWSGVSLWSGALEWSGFGVDFWSGDL